MFKDTQFVVLGVILFIMRLILLTLLFIAFTTFTFKAQISSDKTSLKPPFYDTNTVWVDSVMQSLTIDQRIGQLFMVAAYSNKGDSHKKTLSKLIKEYHIGGLMFMQGGPIRQARLTNHYQSIATVPLMISQDAEWGLSMRIDSTLRFPWQMTLGAIQDEQLVYEMGVEIARQCKRLGVHINFAPVVDVNSNPNNPIINNRSFGEDPNRVAILGINYMQGLQDGGVLACAKHFPGHGDTDTDSHKTLPIIPHTKERLDSIDLVPFKQMFNSGLGSIMVAHLYIPELDNTKNLASTLSPKIVTDLLKKEMGFEGLIFTDALNMKGVSDFYDPGELDIKALLAGNDVLLFAEDVPKAIEKIKDAIVKKQISQDELDKRCRKILLAKKWFGLDEVKLIKEDGLFEDLTNNQTKLLNRKLVKNSITLLQNSDDLIPIKNLDTLKIASLSIGKSGKVFQSTLSKYAAIDHFHISEQHTDDERKDLLKKLSSYNLVLASVHKSNENAWKSYHIHKNTDVLLQTLAIQSKVVLTIFANPYSISDLLMTYAFDGLMVAYQNSEDAQEYSAQAIFGGIGVNGKLPVSNMYFSTGDGLKTENIRLNYIKPFEIDVKTDLLYKVDSIVLDAIKKEAIPGCQIMALKGGQVFYQKNFGYHTYKKKHAVKDLDVYDLASITKIVATVPALMYLQEKKLFDLNNMLGDYLLLSDTSSKKNMKIREVLAHQSQLQPWIPFFKQTLEQGGFLRDTLYSKKKSKKYSIRVAEGIYLHHEYSDSIFEQVVTSKLLEKKEYKYSDLGYYLLHPVIENLCGQKLNEFTMNKFYKPLGLSTMGFLPRERIQNGKIVPTEFDYYFRSQLLQGDVHDMGAAMFGGVAAHAGLFSNANDLAIFMQMYLQGGKYAGERYFQAEIVDEFTKCQFCEDENRRGAGFDKAALSNQEGGPACDCAPSPNAFGHSGFTGTLAWADPSEDFVYVFLSNRIHPTAENNKLLKMDIRTKIMEVFYQAIRK